MNRMNTFSVIVTLAAVLVLASGFKPAFSKGSNDKGLRIIPVIVHVDSKGKVTEAKPAYELRPAFVRAIRQTLDQMITKPARRNGKPIRSQLVVTLGMQIVKTANGKSSVSFRYISSKPLPDGSWFWTHTSDNKLALSNQHSIYMAGPSQLKLDQNADAINNALHAGGR
jgi:hypothetical protein